jgi:hypothetical protein
MLGAIFGISKTPKGQDKKRAKKSKGEASVTEPQQQHGEVASYKEPTDGQKIKTQAKYEKRRATEDWVAGRMTTQDHKAVHERANHVLAGRSPHEFKGKTGERKGKW